MNWRHSRNELSGIPGAVQLYRWFVGLNLDDAVWDATVFSKNRDRLLAGEIADAFFREVLALADTTHCLSHEHFTVDGTLLEGWASHKSFRPVDGPPPPSDDDPSNPSANYQGQKRSNTTHRSVTDPDTRPTRKTHHGGALLGYQASVLTENRHGLIVDTDMPSPAGDAERAAARDMLMLLPSSKRRRTDGANKGYDTPDFIEDVRILGFTPHVSSKPRRHRGQRSAIDRRTRWLAVSARRSCAVVAGQTSPSSRPPARPRHASHPRARDSGARAVLPP